MSAVPDRLMTSDEFIDWAMRQPSGRYELVGGRVVAMAPERTRHNLAKARVWQALSTAVEHASLPCTVFTDGMTVVIDEHHSRDPDAAVQCGRENPPDAGVLEAPMVVVEVVSPSRERDDTGAKLVEYFSVASIQHYLIVNPEKRVVVHHRREGSEIRTRIAGEDTGALRFDPPGFAVSVAALLAERSSGRAMIKVDWDIRNEGRAWRGEEAMQRYYLGPEKFEMVDGKLLWSDEDRENLLGCLLENVGADRAVQLGNPDVWRAAVAKLNTRPRR